MGSVNRPSTIDQLPEEIRGLIGDLRRNGCTIDTILGKLRELDVDVSRSALGRHVRGLNDIGERMRRSREMATALVDRFGDKTDNRLARLNLELMHSIVMETITAAAEDEDGNAQPVTFDPAQVMFLSKALGELTRAQKVEDERLTKAKKEVEEEATKKLDTALKSGEIDAEAVERAKRILGFD